jgi:zinc transport system substrate-binding protein
MPSPKSRFLSTLLIIVCLLASLFSFPGCTEKTPAKLKVTTTTSLMAIIAQDVGGNKIEVANIIPPAQCPGHFDVKPSDIQLMTDARLFLMHGWQGEMFSSDLITSANNPNLTVVVINTQGNWMTPHVQIQATKDITQTLCEVDEDNKAYYQDNAEKRERIIQDKGNEMKAKLEASNTSEINVLCTEQQTGFVQWAGFNVIATYGRPDELTVQKKAELVDQGKETNVALIIDNLQSGASTGVQTAQEIGADQVTLSNFPGGFSNTETWDKAIEKNVDLLLEALKEYRDK